MSQSLSSLRPLPADPVRAPTYRLCIDYAGARQISTHRDHHRAYRALITFAIDTDSYLHAQQRETHRQGYALLDITAPHQRNPRVTGRAVIEQRCHFTQEQ